MLTDTKLCYRSTEFNAFLIREWLNETPVLIPTNHGWAVKIKVREDTAIFWF